MGLFPGVLLAGTPGAAPTKLLSMTPLDMIIVLLSFVVVLGIGFYLGALCRDPASRVNGDQ